MAQPFEKNVAPEEVGVSTGAIERFLERTEKLNMHAFMVVRRGCVAAEAYWPPFTRERLHRLYSVSKSVTSAAIGILAGEGKLRLNDRVADWFQDQVSEDTHPYLLRTTVRDLLMMAAPHTFTSYRGCDMDWLKTFWTRTPDHAPGTIYNYDTAATLVLCHLIRRITGQELTDYLRPRLLDPIGASADITCVQAPEGVQWGGSGVLATLRDMAKIGYVFMKGGRWGERQLIPEWYCREATTRQIDNSFEGGTGYGYQIRSIPGGFSFNGMGGQYVLAFPEKDLLFACHADTQYNPAGDHYQRLKAAGLELIDSVTEDRLPPDPQGNARLANKIADLTARPLDGELDSPVREMISGRTYVFDGENSMGLRSVCFRLDGREGRMEYVTSRGRHTMEFGFGFRKNGVFPENHYSGARINQPKNGPYACQASAAWTQKDKLAILTYITDDYLGGVEMEFMFCEDEISVHMAKVAEWFLDEYQGFASGRWQKV